MDKGLTSLAVFQIIVKQTVDHILMIAFIFVQKQKQPKQIVDKLLVYKIHA